MRADRRRRAIGFAAAAALCAGLAAAAVGGQRPGVAVELGELREVVVARAPIRAELRLSRREIDRRLDVRRVPERFVPPGVLTAPLQALGRVTATSIEPGGYLLATHLDVPGARSRRGGPRLGGGRHPIEIAVSAVATLAAGHGVSRFVDVVVTSEPGPGGGAGRTYVAAERVQLLDLRGNGVSAPADALPGAPAERWVATLALRRADALRLIHAESFARSVRLIPR